MSSLSGGHYTKNGIKQLPARVVLSLNGVGLGGDETHSTTITIVRDTRVFPDGEAPPDFNSFDPVATGISWDDYGAYWYAGRTEGGGNFKTAWNLNPADYYQICNEQGGNDPWAYQRLVDIERAIMKAANADGRKCCVLNLAGGSPGDFEMWKSICAPFIVEAWENGGNIYGRHVYGGPDLVDALGNPLPGQPQRVIAELEYLKSIGYKGGVVLTECGLNGGYGTVSFFLFEQQVIDWQDALIPYADILLGFCWWEIGSTEFEADYTSHMKQLLPYLNTVDLPRWTPPTIDEDDGEETMSLVTVKFYSPTGLLLSQELVPPEGTVMVTTDVLLGTQATPPPDDNGDGDDEPVPPIVPPSVVINDIVDQLPKHPTLSYGNRAGGEDDVTAITIHHTVSGSSLADITAIASYHVNTRGWSGIAYHYCITADGQIYQTNRLVTKSAHSGGNNHYAIGIAILGDFTNKPPTVMQLTSCNQLVDYLIGERLKKVNHIWGHRDMPTAPDAGTQCPGNTYLDWIGPIANKPLPLPSTKFNGGDVVKVVSSSALNLRATPFGSVLASYPSGTELIVSHPYSVLATGFVWWAVEVAGNKGWVAEDYIALVGGPPSPIGELIDVAPYFVPSGQYGSKIVMKVGAGTQPLQLEKRAGDVILRKGDGNWIDNVRYQDSEQWRVKDGQIQKGVDTSDAGNGGRDAYDLGWAQWIPQMVQVNQTYHSTPTVRRFNRVDCQTISTSQANDYLTIKAIIPTWVSPANPNIVLSKVLIVEWRSGTPDLSVPPNETYYFSKETGGYVGWNDNFVVEITEGQAPLSGALDCGQ